jgi:hypothetical protein
MSAEESIREARRDFLLGTATTDATGMTLNPITELAAQAATIATPGLQAMKSGAAPAMATALAAPTAPIAPTVEVTETKPPAVPASAITKVTEEDYLDMDKAIPGQNFVLLSFLSPENVLKKKDAYMFSRFAREYYDPTLRDELLKEYLYQLTQRYNAKLSEAQADVARWACDIVAGHASSSVGAVRAVGGASESKGDDSATVASAIGASAAPLGASAAPLGASAAPLGASAAAQPSEAVYETIMSRLNDIFDKKRLHMHDLIPEHIAFMRERRADIGYEKISGMYDDYLFKYRKELEEKFFAENEYHTTQRGLKVRGTYESYKEAAMHAKTLQRLDPHFHVYVGRVGFWMPWDPNPEDVAEEEHADNDLNTLMKKYKANQAKRDEFFQERVREATAKGKKVPSVGVVADDRDRAREVGADRLRDYETMMTGVFDTDDLALARKVEGSGGAASGSLRDSDGDGRW